jgi:hypothetical protein
MLDILLSRSLTGLFVVFEIKIKMDDHASPVASVMPDNLASGVGLVASAGEVYTQWCSVYSGTSGHQTLLTNMRCMCRETVRLHVSRTLEAT